MIASPPSELRKFLLSVVLHDIVLVSLQRILFCVPLFLASSAPCTDFLKVTAAVLSAIMQSPAQALFFGYFSLVSFIPLLGSVL